jgi:hypothetical protein
MSPHIVVRSPAPKPRCGKPDGGMRVSGETKQHEPQ